MAENGLFGNIYNPDVLTCIANLSNDEVFTPPDIANEMLDMLPQELFENPDTTFLDPACKSGVFLREIAKRLIKGLEWQIPDLQERLDHIFHKQLFGIAITELTSLLSRRSLYCTKYPNSEYSVSKFDDAQGNIRFKRVNHTWGKTTYGSDGKPRSSCIYCGASKEQYERGDVLETHAYELIHTTMPEEIFNMKFDVVISNPPYQLSDGGGGIGTSARPLYNEFVSMAKKLKPHYISMIIPSRWVVGGKGLDKFRQAMLNDTHIREFHDFFDAADVFPGVDISGGVCYFLWDSNFEGDCKIVSTLNGNESTAIRPLLESDSFIRFNEAVPIVHKVASKGEESFANGVAARKPFGLPTNAKIMGTPTSDSVKVYAYPKKGYVTKAAITKNREWIGKYKVCVANVYGERGKFPYLVLSKPFIVEPDACCTETYIVLRACNTKLEAENIISYVRTKFFRFLTLLIKNTPNATQRVYSFVPEQDFSKPWTDEELYEKYGITKEEQEFINSMVRPMDLEG